MKNRYDISNELLILRALSFFVENPYQEIYLREFSRRMGISLNSSQRFLNKFLKLGLIVDFRKGNLRYFKANMESKVFKSIKITFTLNEIESSGLIRELKDIGVNYLVLFGSNARGEGDVNSDYDFVIITTNKSKVHEVLSKFRKKINREIQYQIFNLPEWKRQGRENRAFYEDVIKDGIALIGEIPLIN